MFFKVIRPSSIALLPPDIWAPLNISDLSPTLKYSLLFSSVPDLHQNNHCIGSQKYEHILHQNRYYTIEYG